MITLYVLTFLFGVWFGVLLMYLAGRDKNEKANGVLGSVTVDRGGHRVDYNIPTGTSIERVVADLLDSCCLERWEPSANLPNGQKGEDGQGAKKTAPEVLGQRDIEPGTGAHFKVARKGSELAGPGSLLP